jgi:hypothetical protein
MGIDCFLVPQAFGRARHAVAAAMAYSFDLSGVHKRGAGQITRSANQQLESN